MSKEETEDIYELIHKMHTVQAANGTSIAQTHVTKKIDSDSLFLVGYGDLHIENLGTDLERIERELKIMASIPNLYVVFMGDLTDSSVKYLNNNFDTYLTPKAAREFGYRIFDALGKKLICALSGCHEKHGEEVADFDYIEEYCKRNDVPFLNERGQLTLELNSDRKIEMALAHKAQGYSMYNPFHPCIRLVREHYPNADVVITAHQHQSGIAIQNEQDKPRAMMTIGSRKQGDRYATRRGFTPQTPNKNLPVLEIVPGGYKILNDITLLKNNKVEERYRKLGESLLKHEAKKLGKNEEKRKLEELKVMGFANAVSEDAPESIDLARNKAEREKEDGKAYEIKMNQKIKENIKNDRETEEAAAKPLDFDLHLTLAEGKLITAHNMEVRKREEAIKQAEEHPSTEEEKRVAKKRKKDLYRKRAHRATNRKAYNKYMQNYMQKYRKRKKKSNG